VKDHIITPTHIVCGNCGIQLKPDPIREEGSCRPLEMIVAEEDRIRELQHQAYRLGIEYRHSVAIAANRPVERGAP
jgi:hypothetical protein